jgi:hypothetical protein
MITLLLVAAALAWLFWPRGTATNPRDIPTSTEDLFRIPPAAATPPAPPPAADGDPRPALDQILRVRETLKGSGRLDEANAAAVDRLVLELVHGKAEAK